MEWQEGAAKMKTIIMLCILLVAAVNINSQVSQEWEQRYNGSGNGVDVANSMAVDALSLIHI